MKKLFILILASLSVSVFCFVQGKDFKSPKQAGEGEGRCSLVEGSVDVLNEDAGATLVFDFTNTHMANFDRKHVTYEDLGPWTEYIANQGDVTTEGWPEIVASVLDFSKDKINKTKSYKLHIDEANPKYEMKIVFEYLNSGSTGATMTARMFGAGGAAFSGNLIITEISTGNVALNLRLDFIYGVSSMGYHYTPNKRLQCTIGDIFFGKYLPEVYKKNK